MLLVTPALPQLDSLFIGGRALLLCSSEESFVLDLPFLFVSGLPALVKTLWRLGVTQR